MRLNVNANLPGGDPATMAASIASPLERQCTTIAGVVERHRQQQHHAHVRPRQRHRQCRSRRATAIAAALFRDDESRPDSSRLLAESRVVCDGPTSRSRAVTQTSEISTIANFGDR